MTTDAQTLVGVIENIEIKDAPPESGKEWRLFAFKIRGPAGTHRYSTFDKGWPTNLIGGKTYRFTFKEKQGDKGTLRDLTGAVLVDPSEFGAQPASNGEFKQPYEYEPPTDEAKARVTSGEPQPEFKSPSRSYDQNRDIERRSIERQVALKAAAEIGVAYIASGSDLDDPSTTGAALLEVANQFFAWLREAPTSAPESPAEPISADVGSGEPTDTPLRAPSHAEPVSEAQARAAGERGGKTAASHEAMTGETLIPEPESDGGPALSLPGDHFADVGAFRTALKDQYGLSTTAEVNKALDEAGLGPLAQVGNLDEAFAAIKAHRSTEAT